MALFRSVSVLFKSRCAKLRKKASVRIVMSVCLSAWKQLGSQWTDFHEIWYLSIFSKNLSKIPKHTVWSINKIFGQPDDGRHTGPKHVVVYYI